MGTKVIRRVIIEAAGDGSFSGGKWESGQIRTLGLQGVCPVIRSHTPPSL